MLTSRTTLELLTFFANFQFSNYIPKVCVSQNKQTNRKMKKVRKTHQTVQRKDKIKPARGITCRTKGSTSTGLICSGDTGRRWEQQGHPGTDSDTGPLQSQSCSPGCCWELSQPTAPASNYCALHCSLGNFSFPHQNSGDQAPS